MSASGGSIRRADSVALEAIRNLWPIASNETITRLVRASSVVEKTRGTVMREGERPSRVAVVLSGTVVLIWSAPDGRIAYAGLYGPGQMVGLTTLNGASVPAGIDALTKVTILVWPSLEFRSIADSDLAVSSDLLDRAIYGVQLLNHLIKVRTFTTAACRLAGLLLQYEAFVFSKDAPLLARGQLSALAGVTPQMVSRIIRKGEAAGIIRRVGASGLELLDRRALEAAAGPLDAFPAPDEASRGTPTRSKP